MELYGIDTVLLFPYVGLAPMTLPYPKVMAEAFDAAGAR